MACGLVKLQFRNGYLSLFLVEFTSATIEFIAPSVMTSHPDLKAAKEGQMTTVIPSFTDGTKV